MKTAANHILDSRSPIEVGDKLHGNDGAGGRVCHSRLDRESRIFCRRPWWPDLKRAFTMVEVMIAVGIFSLVVAGSAGVYVMCQKFWHATSLNMQTSQMARKALSQIINGVGTNAGLREASEMTLYNFPETVGSSAYLHSHLWPSTYQYWEFATNIPPRANDARLDFNCSYASWPDDGCWRLKYSNASCGVQYLDYNATYRTLSLGTNYQNRVLLATYVSRAVVTTNAQDVNIALSVMRRDGNLVSTSSASASVRFRNKI